MSRAVRRIAIVTSLALAASTLVAAHGVQPPAPADGKLPLKQPKGRASSGLKAGDTAPAFSLKDSTGKTVALADLKGKVVLLDFWATWCGPCVAAMPTIQKVHEKYAKNANVVVIGMNLDDAQAATKLMSDKKLTYKLLLNAQPAATRYRVGPIPAMFIIDGDGRIAHSKVGFGNAQSEEAELVGVIEEQLTKLAEKKDKDGEDKPAAAEPAGVKKPEPKPAEKKPADAPKP